MWMLLAVALAGPARAEDRLVWDHGRLVLNGAEVKGSRSEKLKNLHEILMSCPASADIEQGRRRRLSAGEAVSAVSLAALVVARVRNPYAVGVAWGLGAVFLVGDGLMLSATRHQRAIAAYNEDCFETDSAPE